MNQFYGKGVEKFGLALENFTSQNIKAMLVTGTYSPNMDTDEFVAVIPSPAIISRSANLAGKSNTLGVFNCSTINFSLVATGNLIPYVVFYQDTGVDATSPLLFKYDTGNGLPVTSIGGDIAVQIDTGPNKLARL